MEDVPYPLSQQVQSPGSFDEAGITRDITDSYHDPFQLQSSTNDLHTKTVSSPTEVCSATSPTEILKFGVTAKKLLQREKEISLLQEVFDDVSNNSTSRIVVLRGESGSGKTTLARFLFQQQQQYTMPKCYYMEVKFHLSQGFSVPYSAFVSAVDEFVLQTLSNQLEQRDKILQSIMTNFDAAIELSSLLEMIPALKTVVPVSNSNEITNMPERSGECPLFESAKIGNSMRFQNVFYKLMKAITSCSKEKGLVLFVDDFQWADKMDIDLINGLVRNMKSHGILVVIATQDSGETNLTLPQSASDSLVEIVLNNVDANDITKLLSEILEVQHSKVELISKIVSERTEGNLFLIIECIHSMTKNQVQGYFDFTMLSDEGAIKRVTQITTEIVDSETMDCIRTAACFGTAINNEIFQFFINDKTASLVAQHRILTFHPSTNSWIFTHGKFQEIAYETISTTGKEIYHYRIGRKLWRALSMDKLQVYIAEVVGQLVLGQGKIQDVRERHAVAKLCAVAGRKAAEISSFHRAKKFFMDGIGLLDSRSWRDEYELCLSLYSGAAECNYSSGNVDKVQEFVDIILSNARSFNDTIRVRVINVNAIGSSGQLAKAVHVGLDLIKSLGEPLPSNPTRIQTKFEFTKLRKVLNGCTDEYILNLPVIADEVKMTVLQTLNIIFPYVMFVNPEHIGLLGFRIVSLSLKYGISGLSCVGFALYASTLCIAGYVHEGYRFGQVAIALHEKFQNKYFLPRFYACYYRGVHAWTKPMAECVEPLLYAYRVGFETGDIEHALLCGSHSYVFRFDRSPLSEIKEGLQEISERMQMMQQGTLLTIHRPLFQCIRTLMAEGKDEPVTLCHQTFNPTQASKLKSLGNIPNAISAYFHLLLLYLFGDHSDATLEVAKQSRFASRKHFSPYLSAKALLMDGLYCIARARSRKRRRSSRARECSQRILTLSNYEPSTYYCRYLILEAELLSLASNDTEKAYPLYYTAIVTAKECGTIMEHALANELAARYMLRRHDKDLAIKYVQAALTAYMQWEASGKVRHLKDEMTQRYGLKII